MSKRLENILMKRDVITREDARSRIDETRQIMLEKISNDDYEDAEEFLYDNLGLELDYIFEIFGG